MIWNTINEGNAWLSNKKYLKTEKKTKKESTCQCRRLGLNPWVRKIPCRRKWQPIPVFLPGKSYEQRSVAGCSEGPCTTRTAILFQMENNEGWWGRGAARALLRCLCRRTTCSSWKSVQQLFKVLNRGTIVRQKKIQEAANKKIDFIWGFKNLGGTDTSNLKRCSK